MVTRLKGDLNDSKNFTIVIKTPKKRRVPVPQWKLYDYLPDMLNNLS